MKGSGLYPEKRGCDEITYFLVAVRTNLIPLLSLTHAEGGMASVNSAVSFLFLTTTILLTGILGKLSSSDTTISKLPKTEQECPKKGNSELIFRKIG